jgi:hypothetical protein
MLIKTTKIALAAAIVVCTAVAAPAASKNKKIAVHRASPQTHVTVPRSPAFSDTDSPEASGGGSLGYNRSQYDDW